MTSEEIDGLLVRYLGLLDEYTRLRAALATRQAAMYGHLARANFAAERGFRYGPDHFDGRMQALARVAVANDASGVPTFTIRRLGRGGDKEVEVEEAEKTETSTTSTSTKADTNSGDAPETAKEPRPKDPLQWFGVLTPMALRLAQKEAIEVVDEVVPRLATLSSDMAAVEIEVRRARKKRARAAAAEPQTAEVGLAATEAPVST